MSMHLAASVKALREKRSRWLEALSGTDRHSIINQVLQMTWDLAVFRVVNEARGMAPVEADGSRRLNGMVHQLLDRGFFDRHVLAVRRLTEPKPMEGPRGIYSLAALLAEIRACGPLLSREVIIQVEFPDEAPSQVRTMLRDLRQEHIDELSGASEARRQPSDSVSSTVIENLQAKVSRARSSVVTIADKFIAHAAAPWSRAAVGADSIKISLDDIVKAHTELCHVAGFVSIYVLGDSCPGFLPVPQFDQFEHFEGAFAAGADMPRLQRLWNEIDSESHGLSQWGIEEYQAEFASVAPQGSQHAAPAT